MKRLLLIAALLVAGAAPAWAQSDSRWIAIFAPGGTLGKGGDRYGDPQSVAMWKNPHVVETMLQRMGIPYKVILLPDSSGGWSRQLGDTRDVDQADSTHFRVNGCMGWISFMEAFSVATALKQYTGEIRSVFTDAEGNTGTQRGSPVDGNWGIPGVMFLAGAGPISNASFRFGVAGPTTIIGHARNRALFSNGDSVSTENFSAYLPRAGEEADITAIISVPEYDPAVVDSPFVSAWRYKTNCLYYSSGNDPYNSPTMLMLGLADLLNRAGYVPRRKLNLHIDADHPYPDATVQTAPSESLAAYVDRMPWRYGAPIETHNTETADDNAALATFWKARKSKFPSHPHSHNYLNFGNADAASGSAWNFSTFADSATKRARWNDMEKSIADTIRANLNQGYERTATFPNNDVMFPDLYIFASAGYRHIRSRAIGAATGVDSTGAPQGTRLRRWQQVPGPRPTVGTTIAGYGLPYAYIEPKTNKLLYVHDSVESPVSADSLTITASHTDYSVSMEGFAARNLSGHVRMAIFDGGQYWHPDLNLTRGRFMADFYRRLTYFYGRTKNILTVEPIYRPRTPRSGGTARP